ncbi:multicopper oxidase domain-containing protein [Nocardia sp. 004]|uniref:multicopper oxidase domain-containing protein n=1 Tax=Nocardia sp. 004 TaxID=3385978 RepID=UPI00399FDF28
MIATAGGTVAAGSGAADPGQWMWRCHNAYHGQCGMSSMLSYRNWPVRFHGGTESER